MKSEKVPPRGQALGEECCKADLDAHGFCGGYSNPRACMGVALDRYLPGRNTMLATITYVKLLFLLGTIINCIECQTTIVTYLISISVVYLTEFPIAFWTRRKIFVILFKFKQTADWITQ